MIKRKIPYNKLTFILSVIGFIGSLGFYIGVLRQVYSEPDHLEKQFLELQKENHELRLEIKHLKSVLNKNG